MRNAMRVENCFFFRGRERKRESGKCKYSIFYDYDIVGIKQWVVISVIRTQVFAKGTLDWSNQIPLKPTLFILVVISF